MVAVVSILLPGMAAAQSAEELALKLANPVASLISVPIQANYDQDVGPADGERYTINIQPVVPVGISEEWNLISRTVLPVVDQDDAVPGSGSQTGLGDTVQSLFFSPKAATSSGWIWGAGPVLLLPTGSEDELSAEKWGAGPTAVALKQQGPWTYGMLANHLWSFAGKDERADVSQTFLQPFLSYTTSTALTLSLNTESSYDWEAERWTVPLNVVLSKVTRLGDQLVSIGGGIRYWADAPAAAPEGLGFRLQITLLFPRG